MRTSFCQPLALLSEATSKTWEALLARSFQSFTAVDHAALGKVAATDEMDVKQGSESVVNAVDRAVSTSGSCQPTSLLYVIATCEEMFSAATRRPMRATSGGGAAACSTPTVVAGEEAPPSMPRSMQPTENSGGVEEAAQRQLLPSLAACAHNSQADGGIPGDSAMRETSKAE